ncbi:hypothetical protein ACH5AL_24475 [Actinacidiphila glaucinigra]
MVKMLSSWRITFDLLIYVADEVVRVVTTSPRSWPLAPGPERNS